MKSNLSALTFVENPHDLQVKDDPLIAWIPQTVSDGHALFDVFATQLHFPNYFGNNWDAFSDMLRDLSWLSPKCIIIAHENLPVHLGEATLKIYLETLVDSLQSWKPEEAHELLVLFPTASKELIQKIMGTEENILSQA